MCQALPGVPGQDRAGSPGTSGTPWLQGSGDLGWGRTPVRQAAPAAGRACKCGVLSGIFGKGAGKAAPGTCRCSKGCGVPGDAREPPHFHGGVGGVVAGAVPWSVWGCGGRWVPGRAGWVLGEQPGAESRCRRRQRGFGAAPCPVLGGPCWDGDGAGFRVTDTSRRSPCGLGSPGCSQDLPRAPVPTGLEGNPPGWAGSREGVIAAALCCCCCEVWGQTPRALTPLRVKLKALGTPTAPFVLSQSDPDPNREGCWEGGAAVGALSSSNPVTDPAPLVTSAAQHCSRGRECG